MVSERPGEFVKQVVQSARTGRLKLAEVAAPRVRPLALLVRTRTSVISPGTERMVVDFARKSLLGKAQARPDLVRKVIDKARRDGIAATLRTVLARLDEPLPLGYSAAGVVEAVGKGLEGEYRVGDRVAVAGAGVSNHAELNVVPRNLAARIPDDVTDEEAAFATLGAIALHGLRNTRAGLGDVVAVIGTGLVGQLAVQLLGLAGARVVALDTNESRLRWAERAGAELVLSPGPEAVAAVQALTGGRGADAVLVAAATDSSDPLVLAADMCRDRARVVILGKVGTEFPYAEYMKKEITLLVSRSYGPGRYDDQFEGGGVKYPVGWIRWTETDNLGEALRLMGRTRPQRLDVAPLITHRFPIADAEAAYRLVVEGQEPSLGVVLTYPESRPITKPSWAGVTGTHQGACRLGVIGAGNFARSVLLPEFRKLPDVAFHTLVTARGITAEHGRDAFGFQRASTEPADILDDPSINAVLVATPHAMHAELTARALAAGKAVFVEKPLALDREGLNRVIAARNSSSAFFTVGFNRRFAPMVRSVRDRLARTAGPKVLMLRINAGPLPTQGWLADDREGGRVLGEACHFIDLARFLAGAPITAVHASAPASGKAMADDAVISLEFADGSVAAIVYTGFGDPAVPKERIEGFAGGAVAIIDNFRSLTITAGGRAATESAKLGADKGHSAEIRAFVEAVRAGGPAPLDEAELVETSLATIAALESLHAGEKIFL